MVRLGIGLYGVDGNKGIQQQLKNVTYLKNYHLTNKKSKSWRKVSAIAGMQSHQKIQ